MSKYYSRIIIIIIIMSGATPPLPNTPSWRGAEFIIIIIIIVIIIIIIIIIIKFICHVNWAPVTTARRVLRLQMEETVSGYGR